MVFRERFEKKSRFKLKLNYALVKDFAGLNFTLLNWLDKTLRNYTGFFLKNFAFLECCRLHQVAHQRLVNTLPWAGSVVRQERYLRRVCLFGPLRVTKLKTHALQLIAKPYTQLGFAGVRCEVRGGEVVLFLKHYSTHRRSMRHLYQAFTALRNRAVFGMTFLVDLFAVDRLGQPGITQANRFVVTYNLFNPLSLRRVFVEVRWAPGVALPTLSKLYDSIGWAERELWDMHGVRVVGHADLRRLLTDYGFRGFPLRKDFPSLGFLQVRFDEKTDSVLYEATSVMQEDRDNPSTGAWGAPAVTNQVATKRFTGGFVYAKALIKSNKFSFCNLVWKFCVKDKAFFFLPRRFRHRFKRRGKRYISFYHRKYNRFLLCPRGVPVVMKSYPWHKLAPVWEQWYLRNMVFLYRRRWWRRWHERHWRRRNRRFLPFKEQQWIRL